MFYGTSNWKKPEVDNSRWRPLISTILAFPLPVTSDSFTDSTIGMQPSSKMGGSRWNFVSILSRSRDMPEGYFTSAY